ncbi:MAG: glycosyltransferase family 4 protein [Armatimonadetes bacterium]|nr:glycosyltransferase family 4 protein [Armatimonadota bacterium]
MRILALTPSFYPAVGGVETHVRRVSETLAERNYDVTVLTHSDEPGEEQLGALRVVRLRRSNMLAAWRGARPYLASADVIHCHDAYSFFHFYLPSCWLPPRRPVFATFHGYERYPIPAEATRRRAFMRRRIINCLCMGDFICQYYETACYAVSYGGVDPVPDPPPPPPATPSAVFIGRLAEDTSLMLYLEALVALRDEHQSGLHLTVAGDGPLRPLAEKYVEAHHLSVRFLGTVPNPTPLLAESTVAFVSGYLAIWQALAHRRLVFAVYENELKRDYLLGFPEAKEVLVIEREPTALARRLSEYLGNPSRADPRRELGARLAAESTWDRVADLYLDMYRAHGYE